jgi:hypothetical protein
MAVSDNNRCLLSESHETYIQAYCVTKCTVSYPNNMWYKQLQLGFKRSRVVKFNTTHPFAQKKTEPTMAHRRTAITDTTKKEV